MSHVTRDVCYFGFFSHKIQFIAAIMYEKYETHVDAHTHTETPTNEQTFTAVLNSHTHTHTEMSLEKWRNAETVAEEPMTFGAFGGHCMRSRT